MSGAGSLVACPSVKTAGSNDRSVACVTVVGSSAMRKLVRNELVGIVVEILDARQMLGPQPTQGTADNYFGVTEQSNPADFEFHKF